ncbi:MAG: TonB-dependent receptor [Gammaproteobacteria bacterium]|nr:TonB-dependent receptor [Gammaproteobacteria bacterium]
MAHGQTGVLSEVIVSATRIEQPVEDVNASVQVISRDAIESFSGRSIAEVLQFANGMVIRDTGSSATINLRGFDSDHTLILVDGMRRTEKYAGSNVNNISLEDIERIEIVRGPMSALYGSDALGGVINIITRHAGDRPETRAKLTLGATDDGQRETALLHLSRSWASARGTHRIGMEAKYREPFRLDGDSIETDLREENRLFLNYGGRFKLDSGAKVGLVLEYVEQDDEGTGLDRFDNPYDRFERETRYFVGGNYSSTVGDGTLDLNLGYGTSSATVNRGTTEDETTDFDQYQSELSYAWEAVENHFTNVGVGYRLDDVEISTLSRPVDREISHFYAQDQWAISDKVELTVGGRYDDYSDFGDAFNPRATLAWRPGKWAFRISQGTGFKAPTLLNLYMQDMVRGRYLIRGNENLEPEESRTTEGAVTHYFDKGQVEFIVHDSKLTDLITSQATGNLVGGLAEVVYQNLDKAEISGAELRMDFKPTSDSRVHFGLEYLDARDSVSDERLADRPRWQARIGVGRRIGKADMDFRIRHVKDFWAADPVPYADSYDSSFTTASLHVDYKLSPALSFFGGVDNLFDRDMPDNMAFRGTPDDPGARYFYVGIKGTM